MTDRTSTRKEAVPNGEAKVILLISGTTLTGGTDTLTLTLADYGLTYILAVEEYIHTTDYDVIVVGGGVVTAVDGGVLTVTTSSGNDNKRRVIRVEGI